MNIRFRTTPIGAALALALLVPAAACAQEAPPAAAAQAPSMERASASRIKGSADAPVQVIEIADFQCPYCARFALEVYPQLEKEYVETGKVRWIFANMPLPGHARAWMASEAATCAGAVGDKFWPVHDKLFEAQAEWGSAADPAALMADYAREAGVPMETWQACVAGDQTATLILQDLLFAASAGVSGTPAFVIDQKELVGGLKSYEEWKAILDKALAEKQ